MSTSINCDGSLLAALVDTPNGPFVFVYDVRVFALSYTGDVCFSFLYRLLFHVIHVDDLQAFPTHEIRLTSLSGSKAACLEWNPAIPNMFAASTNSCDLLVVKVDPQVLESFF